MAGLDPRNDPPRDEDGGFDYALPEQRTVDKAFLDELYATAATAKLMRGYLEALDRDAEFRCSIGSFDEWVVETHG